MQANDLIAYGVEMFVKSIAATCETGTARTVRTMTLIDLDTAREKYAYNHKFHLTMEAPDGVAAGDVLTITVEFKRDSIEEELIRASLLENVEV